MLKFEQICELVNLVASSGVAKVEVEQSGSRLVIEGIPGPQFIQQGGEIAPAAVVSYPANPEGGAPEKDAAEAADDGLELIASPIVGTFYRAANPDAEPYVKVGDVVQSGQVLCIVEAMKLMNEIQSEIAGTIVKVYPENAEPVEFGQTLFAIQPV